MEPKIRFKGFEGEWKEYSLGEVGSIYSGIGFPECEQGGRSGIPFYKVSDMNNQGNESIMHSSNNYVSDKQIQRNHWKICSETPAIFFAKVGAAVMLNRKRIVLEPCLCDNNTMMFSLSKDKWSTNFALPLFNNVDFPSLAQVGSLPSFNGSQVKEIKVKLPKFEEQEMVGKYFTSLDSQISASTSRLASLKQMKAASLQAMFPQEGETVPKIRFKGVEGEWKKVKLNSFAKRVTRKNSHLESTLALTIASAHGLVSQIDYFNNLVVGSNIRNYYLLKKGEFAYNKSYSNGYPFGSVKRLERYEQGILSTLYITFSIDNSISSDYLTHFFDTNLWHKEVAERAAEGARNHGLLNIGANDFLDINIWKPESKSEQQAIASYFTSLDRQISLQSQRLEKLKQIKSACLDKMFV